MTPAISPNRVDTLSAETEKQSIGKWIAIYGWLFVLVALYLFVAGLISFLTDWDLTPGASPFGHAKSMGIVAALFQAVLFGTTGFAVLKGQRTAIPLVWTTVGFSGLGVLLRGLVPLDMLAWLVNLGLAIWYSKKQPTGWTDAKKIAIGVPSIALITVLVMALKPWLERARQQGAREQLARINIQYDAECFVKAAVRGDILAVQLFLDAGMNPNIENQSGSTALVGAAYQGQPQMVRFLLHKGASVNLKDRCETRFSAAARSQKNNIQVMRALLEKGADTNALSERACVAGFCGGTALMTAAGVFNHPNINNLSFLLDMGSDVNTYVGEWKPLKCAIFADNIEAVNLFLNRGAKVEASDIWDGIIMMQARDPAMVKLFIEVASKDPTFWKKAKANPAALKVLDRALRSVGASVP